MRDKTFFTVLVESPGVGGSFIQVFWAWGAHPGEAIGRVLKACRHLGVRNAVASELDAYDFASLPSHVVGDERLGVFYDETRHHFPTEESFRPPAGIIKSRLDGDYGEELIREGFSLAGREGGLYEVEAVVGRGRLFETFTALAGRLHSLRVFWVKIAGDWERDGEGPAEFWVNESLNTPELIADYLTAHANDTINNGHVALTAYSNAGQTNLTVDTHKTIKVLTKSARMRDRVAAALRRRGMEELAEPYSLERGYYHWHYRPTRSKSRARLVAALKRNGFVPWNPA